MFVITALEHLPLKLQSASAISFSRELGCSSLEWRGFRLCKTREPWLGTSHIITSIFPIACGSY
jgi:hypothetical protein